MSFDLYVWKAPRDVDADQAAELVERWLDAGGDPRDAPFEPSSDVGWFVRELRQEDATVAMTTDAIPNPSTAPIWLSGENEPPARVVAITVTANTPRETLESIFGLAGKYDLLLFDARNRRVHLPLQEMADHADATFWPGGAIQAAVAGGLGAVVAVAAWSLGIPLVSGVVALIGGFMFVMAVYGFVLHGRRAIARRTGR